MLYALTSRTFARGAAQPGGRTQDVIQSCGCRLKLNYAMLAGFTMRISSKKETGGERKETTMVLSSEKSIAVVEAGGWRGPPVLSPATGPSLFRGSCDALRIIHAPIAASWHHRRAYATSRIKRYCHFPADTDLCDEIV